MVLSFDGVRKALFFSVCLALLVASSACGGTGSGQGAAGDAAQEQPAPDQESGGSSDRGAASTEDTGNNDPNQGDGSAGSAGSTATEPRDGVWTVGDAGEVEFASENGSLSLVEARPASGWTERVEEQGPEEIEVDFFRDNLRYQFTAEIDDGQLEVQVDQQTVGMNPN